jgi:uncharacterized repeat protein (TIGR03803 family)
MRKIFFALICFIFVISVHAQPLYTTTLHGGTYGGGTICKLEEGKLSAVFNFDTPDGCWPSGNLLEASDGKLYGLTSQGGKYNVGIIFSYNAVTHEYSKLKDFDTINGALPYGNLMQAEDGKLYGITRSGGNNDEGVIFSYDINTGAYTKLNDFDYDNGSFPNGSLVQADNGNLYGTTLYGGRYGLGVVFSFNPFTNICTKLIDCNDDSGWYCTDHLVFASNGKLYGMTRFGGGENNGLIFSLDPVTSVYKKLADFPESMSGRPEGNLIQASDGKLYGMTFAAYDEGATIFSFSISTSTFSKFKTLDTLLGSGGPNVGLLQISNGKLYGISCRKSDGKCLIFSLSPGAHKYTVEHFKGLDDQVMYSNLIQASNGKLYGISERGGSGHLGLLFSLDITKSAYTKLRDFGTNDRGYAPRGALTADSAGVLYGFASCGGRYGKGVIFSFNTATAEYKKLKDWNDAKTLYEAFDLLYANDGKLYGTNPWAGNKHDGTIFSLNVSTGIYKTEVVFADSTAGLDVQRQLIQATDGKLYGMANSGGKYRAGVLFSYDPSGGTYAKLFDLSDSTGTNGLWAAGNLIQASDGKLYGTTAVGGKHHAGVLFSYDINTGMYKRLVDFDYFNGFSAIESDLIQGVDGKLYGKSDEGGTFNNGVLYSYNITTQRLEKLYDYTRTEMNDSNWTKEKPTGYLTQTADGKLYGIWAEEQTYFDIPIGEVYRPGGVYSFDPVTGNYTKLQNFDNKTGLHPTDTFIKVSTSKK